MHESMSLKYERVQVTVAKWQMKQWSYKHHYQYRHMPDEKELARRCLHPAPLNTYPACTWIIFMSKHL